MNKKRVYALAVALAIAIASAAAFNVKETQKESEYNAKSDFRQIQKVKGLQESGKSKKQEKSQASHEDIKVKVNADLEIENVENKPEYLEELAKSSSVKVEKAQNRQIEDVQKEITSDKAHNATQVECAEGPQPQGESQEELAGESAGTETENEGEKSQESQEEQAGNEAVESMGQSKPKKFECADGTYAGKGEGKKGKIKLEVTIVDGRIDEINVISHNETKGFYNRSADKTVESIISSQSAEVDAVSGATRTSNGIKDAVKEALAKAEKSE